MRKITMLAKNSVWYEHKDSIVGETFRVDGDKYWPQSPKAKALAAAEHIEYFVFVGTIQSEDAAEKKSKKATA